MVEKTFENILLRLEKIVEKTKDIEKLKITKKETEILKHPKKILIVNFPLIKENEIKIIQGYRIQHNDALGPTKGGIRFHQEVDLDEVNSLAFLMSLKCSLLNLPYGGAKGGIVINPKEFSEEEIEKISREFIRQIHDFIGPHKDIPAPDIYTNPKIMGIMADEFGKIKGKYEPAVITGKPIELGGIKGREYSTAKGGEIILKEALNKIRVSEEKRVVIHGFGNAGSYLAKFLFDSGFKIIAVSDSSGGIYNSKGFDINRLIEHKKQNKKVSGFENSKEISNEELLNIETDILIPASLGNVITKENADKINSKVILELANSPITFEAGEILNQKGIIILPDILANAGGVVVSYFEWMQNLSDEIWEEERTISNLEQKMKETFKDIYENYVSKYNLDFRTACYIKAIKRILGAKPRQPKAF